MGTSPTIVLVGLMGSGKSTVAERLASTLGVALADTDEIVESKVGKTVRRIFEEDGEAAFRAAETEALGAALASGAGVIAAAGGVVLSETNRAMLNRARHESGAVVVWLRADPGTLVRRTRRGVHRPLLDGAPDEAITTMARERAPLYAEVSDASIDTDGLTVDDVVGSVLSVLDGRGE